MFRKLLPLSVMVFQAFTYVMAQEGSIVPERFDQFFNNYYLVNPANEDTAATFRVRLGNRSLTGLFQGVNRIYFDTDLGIKSKREERFHSIGIQAVNDREGEFFSKSRLYGRYSWRTGLSYRSALAAGISLGIVNYAFRSSAASPGGSSTALDGNAGVWYLRERWKLGASMQQMFERNLQPISQVFVLRRYYNFNLSNYFPISYYLNVTTHLYTRLQKSENLEVQFASLVEIQQRVEAGFNYRHTRGIAFLAGIKRIRFGTYQFSLMASYMASLRKVNSVADNAIEFHISLKR